MNERMLAIAVQAAHEAVILGLNNAIGKSVGKTWRTFELNYFPEKCKKASLLEFVSESGGKDPGYVYRLFGSTDLHFVPAISSAGGRLFWHTPHEEQWAPILYMDVPRGG